MNRTRQEETSQTVVWNGVAGQSWVTAQALLDQLFAPFEERLVEAAALARPRQALDIGCGTGGVTLAVARALGPAGRAVGIDISAAMVAAAEARAREAACPAGFIQADAGSHRFEPGAYDLLISRFGVMFFEAPVAAFANLRRAATPDARLRAIAWRSPGENPFMTTAERAAAPLLPDLPPRRTDAPGQFAFADAERVRGILEASGWRRVEIAPLDLDCVLPAAELERYFTLLGPVGRLLPEVDAQTRAQVVERLHGAFAPFVRGAEVRFAAACWWICAEAA